jgi:predicted transcriptional regulator
MKEKEHFLTDYETFADRLERLLVEKKMQKAELAERIGFPPMV